MDKAAERKREWDGGAGSVPKAAPEASELGPEFVAPELGTEWVLAPEFGTDLVVAPELGTDLMVLENENGTCLGPEKLRAQRLPLLPECSSQ